MKKQTYYLYQLQQFDNTMDNMYKGGLPCPESGRKPGPKQEQFLKQRKRITGKIHSQLFVYYERLRKTNIRSNVVVEVTENAACQGCFMTITKSRLIELIKGETLISCEHCGRILHMEAESQRQKLAAV
jgi:predicted  nucleic acid-binding Zn-ribbon protein